MPIICEIRGKKLTCENIWKPFLLVSKILVTVYWFSFFSGTTQIVKFSQFVHRHFNTKTENQKQTWYKTTKKLLSSQHEYYCSKPTSIIRYHWYHMKRNVQVLTIPWAENGGAYPHMMVQKAHFLLHMHTTYIEMSKPPICQQKY